MEEIKAEAAPDWAQWLAQNEDGVWYWHGSEPKCGEKYWISCGESMPCGRGETLGDWRDTLERRPQAEADITDPFNPEFRPVSVSNETVPMDKPVAVAGTGNGSANESAFLIGRVIDLLRTSVDHFSADELADLNELTGAELTKRDERVCGGQKYLDATWFERGEIPPVGAVCLYVISERLSSEVEITAHAKLGICFSESGKSNEFYVSKTAELHRFRPIRTDRDVLMDAIVSQGFINRHGGVCGQIADAILAAGFKREGSQ